MHPMKKVMVATDMSLLARRAEVRAAMVVRELGCESLDVIYIDDRTALESLHNLIRSPRDIGLQLAESTNKQMMETARNLREHYSIEVTATRLEVGRVHIEIVRYARSIDAGLVVLGAHGGSFIREMFIGSTVDKVLRMLDRPLLIVKQEPRTAYQQVLVPVDFSESSRLGIKIAMHIAPHAKITVLHAFEAPLEARMRFDEVSEATILAYRSQLRAQKYQALREFVSEWEGVDCSLTPVIEFGPAATMITAKAASLGADLIVIGKHGQSAWESMLLGSVTKRVIQEASCDILVVEQMETTPVGGSWQ